MIEGKIRPAMIRIGFHTCDTCNDSDTTKLVVRNKGLLIFKGRAHIGHGSKILVSNGAELILGDNFAISASSTINCYKKIRFGRDVQLSWDCLVMDSDTHNIYGEKGEAINWPREINIDDHNWIGCRSLILKGSQVPKNCVIGANSIVSGNKYEESTIIAGSPARSIKKISDWKL